MNASLSHSNNRVQGSPLPAGGSSIQRLDTHKFAQLGTVDDGITCTAPVRERFPDFAAFLAQGEDLELSNHLRHAETVGRPVGRPEFLAECERLTGRMLASAKRGPKPGSHHKPRANLR